MQKVLVYFLLLIFSISKSYGAFCGSNAAPYSLEVTASGTPILGCAVSTCLGLEQGNAPITDPQFNDIGNGHFDGFIRGYRDEQTPYTNQLVNLPPSQAICNPIPTASCGPNQWVGGINSAVGNGTTPLELICCDVPVGVQQESYPYGPSTVRGGEIFNNGDTPGYPAFDYINNIAKIVNPDGSFSYSVSINRASCASRYQYYPVASSPMYCFSGDTLVTTKNGTQKRMDELKINDWILTSSTRASYFSPVVSWLHKMPEMEAEFVKVTLKEEEKEEEKEWILKLTKKHYIYRGDCSALHQTVPPKRALRNMVFAESLSPSDCLFFHDPKSGKFIEHKIHKIETIKEKGIYSPMTENGNIIVNGILASCLNIVDDKNLQVTFAETLQRLISTFSKYYLRSFNELIGIDLIPGMENLIHFLQFVIPQK